MHLRNGWDEICDEIDRRDRAMTRAAMTAVAVILLIAALATAGAPDATALTKAHETIKHLQSQATVEISGRLSGVKGQHLKARVKPGTTLIVDTTPENTPTFELLDAEDATIEFRGRDTALCGYALILGKTAGSPEAKSKVTLGLTPPDGSLDDPSAVGGLLMMGECKCAEKGLPVGSCGGTATIYGAEKLHAVPLTADRNGLPLPNLHGWQSGDQVIIPATGKGETDEYREIRMANTGARFDRPLQYPHKLPDGSYAPVCNVTRNVRVVSLDRSYSPHTMFMGTPKVVANWEFDGMGRSDAAIPGSIGRYAVHIHRVIGPMYPDASWTFQGLSAWDSADHSLPKYGIVNHGDRLRCVNCIVDGATAAGFYEENGLGEGSWENCVAINSHGLPGKVLSVANGDRDKIDDVVFDGFGFAQHGGTMTLTDCASYGAKTAGFFSYGISNNETGDINRNVGRPVNVTRFTSVGAAEGFRLKYFQKGNQSLLDACRVLDSDRALNTHYGWAGVRLTRSDLWVGKGFENAANTGTNFEFSDNTVHGYTLGFDVPSHGLAIDSITTISGNTFDPGSDSAVDVRLRKGTAFTVNGWDTTLDAVQAIESVRELNQTADRSELVIQGP